MDFQSFLDTVRESVLPQVASYDYYLTQSSPPQQKSGTNIVLIGCGAVDQTAQTQGILVLQNKGSVHWAGKHFSSITRLMIDPAADFVESWVGWPQDSTNLVEFINGLQLVAEDGNPDSIFAFLLLLARAARVPLHYFPREWIDAVDDWERTGTAEQPFQSWCSLESALAHSCLVNEKLDGPSTYTDAWKEGLSFAISCLDQHVHPLQMPLEPTSVYHGKAMIALKQDERVYRDWLQYAPVLQLSLPVKGFQGRYQLVDALVIEEHQLTGAAKNFYRNDVSHSPLREGFTLSLVYRPHSTESAYDVTISVDPRQGVCLKELWHSLEQAETKAWGDEQRPSDIPRRLDGVHSSFNEPWFINSDQTLIGSPRKVKGIFAGKLSWTAVQNLVLRECNPLKSVKTLIHGRKHPVPLLSLTPEYRKDANARWQTEEKTIILTSWPDQAEQRGVFLPRHLPESPTVRRLLAALLNPEKPAEAVALANVATDSSFDYLGLTGGFAIVSDRGLLVLDDWTKESLHQGDIRSAFERAARLHASLNRYFEDELPAIRSGIETLLWRNYSSSDTSILSNRLSILALGSAYLRGSTAVPSANSNVHLLWESMDRRWSLEKRLTALETEIKAIEGALRSINEAHNAFITHFVAIYGFALFLASALASSIAKTIFHYQIKDGSNGDAPGLWVLLTFVFLAALLWCLLWVRDRWANPLKPKYPSNLSITDSFQASTAIPYREGAGGEGTDSE